MPDPRGAYEKALRFEEELLLVNGESLFVSPLVPILGIPATTVSSLYHHSVCSRLESKLGDDSGCREDSQDQLSPDDKCWARHGVSPMPDPRGAYEKALRFEEELLLVNGESLFVSLIPILGIPATTVSSLYHHSVCSRLEQTRDDSGCREIPKIGSHDKCWARHGVSPCRILRGLRKGSPFRGGASPRKR